LISGRVVEGGTVSTDGGRWTGADKIAVTWFGCPTASATDRCFRHLGNGPVLTVPSYNAGLFLRVSVTATTSDGFFRNTANLTSGAPIAPGPIAVGVDGVALVTGTLNATVGFASGVAVGLRWQRCAPAAGACADIPGASAEAYDVAAEDVGLELRVVAVATNAGGGAEAVSERTAQIPVPATSGGIARLNVARRLQGLPANVVENTAFSDGCRKHMNYLRLNPGIKTAGAYHNENSRLPGYTPAGDDSGSHSVLSPGYATDDSRWRGPWTPWSYSSPYHDAQVMDPALLESGYSPGCLYTLSRKRRTSFPRDAVFSVPGPGLKDVPVSQSTTRELPSSPAQALGIKSELVGYNIILYAPGLADGGRLESFSLKREGVPVDVKLVSNILVPPRPMLPATRYDVEAMWRDEAGAVAQRFSFTTAGTVAQRKAAARNALRLTAKARRGRLLLTVRSSAADPLVAMRGRRGALKLGKARPGRAGMEITRKLPAAGRYRACAGSGGATTGVQPRQQCVDIVIARDRRVRGKAARPWCPTFDLQRACRGKLDGRFPRPSA
jgi:hypothetical protein